MLLKVQNNSVFPKFIPQFLLKMVRLSPNRPPQKITQFLLQRSESISTSMIDDSAIDNIVNNINFSVS